MLGMRAAICGLLGGLVLFIGACGGEDSGGAGGTGEGEAATITLGRSPSPSSAAVELGIKHGFFKEEGLEIKKAPLASGAAGVAQLINGQLNVALGGTSGVVTSNARRIPIQIVSGGVADREDPKGTQYQTIVDPDSGINGFDDLEGKTIAVNSVKCCWEFWTREAVEKAGGNPDELQMIQIPFPDQVTAVKQGRVDAVTTLQPFATQLRKDGFKSIGDPAAIAYDDPENGNTNYFMAAKFIEENPETVKKWRRALARSSEYANAHPGETRKAIAELTGASPELVDQVPLPKYTAEIDREAILEEAEFLVKYGVIDEAPPYSELVWQGAQ